MSIRAVLILGASIVLAAGIAAGAWALIDDHHAQVQANQLAYQSQVDTQAAQAKAKVDAQSAQAKAQADWKQEHCRELSEQVVAATHPLAVPEHQVYVDALRAYENACN
jgi:hypothetical protein